MTDAPGAIRSPNIWDSPQVYEIENRAVDRAGRIDATLLALAGRVDWSGATVLDIGCGTGYFLPRFAETAARVVGVEPHAPLLPLARERTAGLPHVEVHLATAQATGRPDGSVDVAHARWAYFFGPGCEPGLAELARVVRPGGGAVVVDIDPSRSTFGGWFRSAYPSYDAAAVRRFWLRRGWTPTDVTLRWAFSSHEDFVAVLGLELPPAVVASAVREAPTATGVDYGATVWWRRF